MRKHSRVHIVEAGYFMKGVVTNRDAHWPPVSDPSYLLLSMLLLSPKSHMKLA